MMELFVIGIACLVFCIASLTLFPHHPIAQDLGAVSGAIGLISLIIVAMMVLLAPVRVFARDLDGRYAASPLHDWFNGLSSKGGGPCCSNADGTALADSDWYATKDGHYRVRIEGNFIDVPDDTVLTEPNRAGRTMVWIYQFDGKPVVRCFMPGAMS